jgi:homeobox-leucine zipper protein
MEEAGKVSGESVHNLHKRASSLSAVSSFSNSSEGEEVEVEKVSSRMSNEDEEASPRKKLRLTKEQSAVLEDSFKEHATLSPVCHLS